ncbi:7-deoxyloganetin glucosyltransferase [Ranunculus cassubicifolius]
MDKPSKPPHLVCIPLPAQGHINPMLKLAKVFHSRGFHITFVHSEFNFQRLFKSGGLNHVQEHSSFHYETIPDGLPVENARGVLDIPVLCKSISNSAGEPFRELILKLNNSHDVPPVSCILSDGVMGFTLQVADSLRIPEFLLFTPSACGVLGYIQYEELAKRGHFPLKDESCLTNGYLDIEVDWVPSMTSIRLKDLPTFLRTTDPEDIMFNYNIDQLNIAVGAKGIILNTFNDLEQEVLHDIKSKFPQLYTVGPLHMLYSQMPKTELDLTASNLWEEDMSCMEWLDSKNPKSVLYVNFGSFAIMTSQQLIEFAWGLANSKCSFLLVIRSDLVDGEMETNTRDFLEEIKGRGLLVSWCSQEDVLKHPSIGGFLTHGGWNSTLESISVGVPMVCWPFFAEQQTNCFFVCKKWGIGEEINTNVKRDEIQAIVEELMEGEKGKEMKNNALKLMREAVDATNPGGSSYNNLERLINDVLQSGVHSS